MQAGTRRLTTEAQRVHRARTIFVVRIRVAENTFAISAKRAYFIVERAENSGYNLRMEDGE